MDDVCHVDVSSSCMDKVPNSNAKTVSVPSDRDNLQPWVGQLSTLSVSQDPTMKRVYSRYVSEMDDLTGTTYSREESYFVDVDGKFGKSHFQPCFYSEVSAAWAPVVMNLGLEV